MDPIVPVDIGALVDVGKRLSHPFNSKDSLFKLLKQAAILFGDINQLPQHNVLSAMKPSMDALVQPVLLKHKDKDIRLLVATCISEIMRIVAPDAPFSDEILKDIFELIVASFKGLNETSSPYFDRRVNILETVATVRSSVVMLDLECDDLIWEMFQTFFSTVSEEPPRLMASMRTIMCLVLEESEEIPQQLLELLLSNLLSGRKEVSGAAYILAGAVFERCAKHLKPYVEEFLTSTLSEGKFSKSRWRESYHDLIFEIYTRAPRLIIPLIPKLTDDLLTDKLDVRLRAVKSLGHLFASQKGVSDGFNQLFTEYVKRFTDKAVEVRVAMVECAKQCLLAKPSGPGAEEFLAALSDRLQDYDNGVRLHVVVAICEYAMSNPELVPVDVLKRVAERLRDTEVFVRRETLQRLTELYRTFCLKKSEGLNVDVESFYWIPSKLIRCCFDRDCKEFRAQAMELVFSEQLLPLGFPVKEKVKCWISFFSAFDNNDVKALERILLQKQRLHHEMQNYLALRQNLKDEESQKKLHASCKSMASSFMEPANAESQLQKLIQLKDNKVLKDLAELLDPNTSLSQSLSLRMDLLKRLGEKHPRHDFLKILATKCSFVLFGKEHMAALLHEIDEFRNLGEEKMLKASVGLLVVFANHFPSLLEGAEGDVMNLLKEDKEFLKEGAVQILAKIGGSMRGQLTEESNSVDLLEKLCVEGNRKQAKYAVQALAAMSSDSGLKIFSALYRKLLDLLESGINLPTILQSLGCIAQNAISFFETWEEDLVNFLVQDLFRRESVPLDGEDTEHHVLSETTRLKIFGLKTLVRSFLPNKDPQQVQRFKGLFGILLKFLECGEVSDEIKSSGFDKAHLRLAAATGVLRLSKRYDAQISPQLFHATVLCARDPSVFVKRQFLSKVLKFLKERAVPHKYACALVLSIGGDANAFLTEAKQQLGDFVESSRRQARLREASASGQLDAPLITYFPEYVLFYLVHTLAQEAAFTSLSEGGPSLEAIEPFFRQLFLFIWALLNDHGEGVQYDERKKEELDKIALILGVFRTMKDAEDTMDASKTENTYILCDIGIVITKDLAGASLNDADNIPLPMSIYKTLEDREEGKQKVDGSHLPSFFTEGDTFSRMKSALPLSMDMVVKQGKRKAANGALEKEDKPLQKRSKVTDISGGDEEEDTSMSPKLPAASEKRQGSGRKRSQNERTRLVENEVNLERLESTTPTSPKRKRGSRSLKDNEDASLSSSMHKRGRAKISNEEDEVVNDEVNLDILPTSERPSADTESAALGADGSARRRVRISIKKPKPPQEPMDEFRKEEDSADMKKRRGKKAMDGVHDDATDNAETQALKSPRGTPRRSAKKISISGLESPDSKVDKKEDASVNDLVGSRIRVWWPIDKKFYQGLVASYQPSRKKHKVVYDDGDVEFLKLEDERWEFLEKAMDDPGSPSTPAPLEHGSQSKKKEVKSRTKRSSKGGSATRSLPRSSRSRKQSNKSETSGTTAKHSETEPSDPLNVSDHTEMLDQGHEVVDGEQTPATVSKGRSKALKRSEKKLSATSRARGLKSIDLKSDDNTLEGSTSPTESKDSKDSDDVPLDAWKTARRKAH